MAPLPPRFSVGNQHGFALPVVLGISLIILIVASSITAHLRTRVQMARELENRAQAFLKLRSGYARTLYGVLTGGFRPSGIQANTTSGKTSYWNLYGKPIELAPGITVQIRDVAGMIPIHQGGKDLRQLVYQLTGDPEKAARFADTLMDWQDEDRFKRLNGAETWEYRKAGLDYTPRNYKIQLPSEIKLVAGFSPEIYDKLMQSVTYVAAEHRNYLTMDRQTLNALINGEELVDTIIELRAEGALTPARFRRITGIPTSMTIAYFPSTKLVIQLRATHEAAKASLSAVIEKREGQSAPFQILEWRP